MAERKKSWIKEVLDVHGVIKAQRKGKANPPANDPYYDPFLWGYIWGSSFDFDGNHHGEFLGGGEHHHAGSTDGSHHGGGHHDGGGHHGGFHHDGGGIGGEAGDIIGGVIALFILTTIVWPTIDFTFGKMADGVRNWSGAVRYVNARRRGANPARPA